VQSAITALHALGLTDEDFLACLRVRELATDGSELRLRDRTIPVPAHLRRALVGQRLHASVIGQRPNDQLPTFDGSVSRPSALAWHWPAPTPTSPRRSRDRHPDPAGPDAEHAAEPADPGACVDVVDVQVQGRGYLLELTFSTGDVRVLDIEPYLRGPVFMPVRDPALFAQVTVDPELGTIVWPNGADLSLEELYLRSTPIGPAPPAGSEEQARRLAAHRAALLSTGWLTLTELAARRGEDDLAAVGGWAAAQLLDRALIVIPAPDRSLIVPAFQLTATGAPTGPSCTRCCSGYGTPASTAGRPGPGSRRPAASYPATSPKGSPRPTRHVRCRPPPGPPPASRRRP
jgi:uncharacterized protein DUF2442